MHEICVNKDELLAVVKANRENHRNTFLEAQKVYRAQMIAELDRMLQEARDGKKIRRAFTLPEPEDHTKDYDRVIGMLEMHTAESITLDNYEYNQFVLDEWGWQASFAANTASYVAQVRR